ncbi:SusC/RagA family TonB-linked outer membrane protein [Algibacter pacificus]|uniref:SusC/RagA family TonB-linked outer membrane protein n=1 Tax=Algibacter pacificus TaxID=2599389 RepID=UPI0011CBAA58|nr:TonB-dependent receptor [Algibacter pacificus]
MKKKSLNFKLLMRISTLLITVMLSITNLFAVNKVNAQRLEAYEIKLTESTYTLRSVIDLIEQTTNFSFIVYEKEIDMSSIYVPYQQDQSLLSLLENLSKKENLKFYRVNNLISVTKSKDNGKEIEASVIDLFTITGVVKDKDGIPLPGATVLNKTSKKGTVTNFDGEYKIEATQGDVLNFSFIGYATQELTVGDAEVINVSMALESSELDEVVIIGYGEQQKRDLTGAVSFITERDIPNDPVQSPEKLLKGRVPGVYISQNSGQPGSATTIRVRGGTSINAGNNPLFIVDGVPMDISTSGSTSGIAQGSPLNPMASIRPENISSMTVLKDASATAIYGSRGANGVIIITTKTGKKGKPTVALNTHFGVQQIRKKLALLNASQFARIKNEAYLLDGEEAPYTETEIAGLGEGTDWQDEVYRSAMIKNYNLSFSGGDDKTKYYISGGFAEQEGIIINSDLKNINFRANINSEISDKFRIGNTLSLNRINTNIIRSSTGTSGSDAGIVNGAIKMDPILTIYNPDGSYVRRSDADTPNPVATALELTNQVETSRIIDNFFGEYDLTESLTFKSTLGINYLNNQENYFKPNTVFIAGNEINQAAIGVLKREHWVNSNTLTYANEFGENLNHSLNLVGGFSLEGNRSELLRAGASNFPNNVLREFDLSSGTVFSAPQTHKESSKLISYLARANYGYKNTYLFTVSARYDGSSKFGKGNKYGFFPSAALAWRVSNEDFMTKQDVISDMKLRASFGVTGNQEIGNYQSLSLLSTVNVVAGDQGKTGIYPANIGNPDLKWETTNQLDFGLEMSLWDGLLAVNADYYRKTTKDLLLSVPVPWTTGFADALVNLGKMQNEGFEIAVNSKSFELGKTKLNFGINLSKNKNEILDLGGTNQFFVEGSAIIVKEGLPLGSFYGYVFDGILQDEADIANSSQTTSLPGDERYVDINNDGTIDADDRKVIGNAQPDLIGGFSANVSYNNLSLSTNFNYVIGNDIYNKDRQDLERADGARNNSTKVLDRWTPTNPSNYIPATGGVSSFSNKYLEDGSYLRLQDVTLAYQLPVNILEKLNLKNLTLSLSAQNLITITNYSGYDPEVSVNGQSSLSQGIDQGVYPTAKTYTLGLQLGF